LNEVDGSVPPPAPPAPTPGVAGGRRKWIPLLIGLALLVAIYFLQRTPSLAVGQPTALKLLPAPSGVARYWGAERIPELRRLSSSRPWSEVVSFDLLKQFLARGAAPAGLAPSASVMESFAFRWFLRSLADDAAVVRDGSNTVAVARLGFTGRVGYNLFRWFGRRARGASYGSTRGVAVLGSSPGDQEPRLHLAMRGPYLFLSPSERVLSAALTLADGSSTTAASLASVVPVTADVKGPRLCSGSLAPGSPASLITAAFDRSGARLSYRYSLEESLPLLPPTALLEAARSIPKASTIYVSAAWPPAVLASLSPDARELRDHVWQWLTESGAEEASVLLESELARPVTVAAGGWIEVPGQMPFPHLLATARTENGAKALEALSQILSVSLEQDFARSPIEELPGAVAFRNEAQMGALAPSAAQHEDQILLASSQHFLTVALASAEGLAPCLADRPEFGGLADFAGKEDVAAVLFTTGSDVARLGSELLLQLAARLSPTAGADARDLLAPGVKRLDRFAGIYGRLLIEPDGKTGRVEVRLNFPASTSGR